MDIIKKKIRNNWNFLFGQKYLLFLKCHKFDLNFINVIGEALKMLSSLNNR